MAAVYVDNGIEMTLNCRQNGTDRQMVWHVVASSQHPTPAELSDSASGAVNYFRTKLGTFSTTVLFVSVTSKDISQAGGGQFEAPFVPGDTGTKIGEELPSSCAACVSLHTGHGGRSGQGRKYVFGLVANDVSQGDYFIGGTQTAMVELFEGLMAALDDIGFTLAIFSRVLAALYPVLSVTVDDTVDSQRRRLAGRGR